MRKPINVPTIITNEKAINGSPTNTVRKYGFAIFLFLTSSVSLSTTYSP